MNQLNKVLITGWFSFDLPYNTAGDLLAKDTAICWAQEAGFQCDVAVPFPKSDIEVDSLLVDQHDYVAVVFVCGPLTSKHIVPFIRRFNQIKRIALNVSVVQTHDLSNEFDVIIPRDALSVSNPDISLATQSRKTPVVGLIYVGAQKEYPSQQHEKVENLVKEVADNMNLAIVPIDTKLPSNEYGLTTISQIESVMSAMDLVITTRLHGSILSLRCGTPVISIDPVPEGAKVRRQMKTLNWPLSFTIGELNKDILTAAIKTALKDEYRELSTRTIEKALDKLTFVKNTFQQSLVGANDK